MVDHEHEQLIEDARRAGRVTEAMACADLVYLAEQREPRDRQMITEPMRLRSRWGWSAAQVDALLEKARKLGQGWEPSRDAAPEGCAA